MLDAATIRGLAENGFTADQIAIVSELFERKDAEVQRKAEERRRKDRERKQKAKEEKGKEKAPTPPKENTPLGDINISPPPDRFDEWWEIYPLKKAKGRARKAWKPAKAKTSEEFLISSLRAWVAKNVGTDPKYIPHPASWLNDERWTDADLRPVEPFNGKPKVRVEYSSPNGEAWYKYLRSTGGKAPRDSNNGWWFDSEWPPSVVPQ